MNNTTQQLEFCHLCGKKKIIKELSTYNTETGFKNTILICPDEDTIDCLHNHDYKYVGGIFKIVDERCQKCGDEIIYPDYY